MSEAKKLEDSNYTFPATSNTPSYQPTPIAVLEGSTSHHKVNISKEHNLLQLHVDESKHDKSSEQDIKLTRRKTDLHECVNRESSSDGKLKFNRLLGMSSELEGGVFIRCPLFVSWFFMPDFLSCHR